MNREEQLLIDRFVDRDTGLGELPRIRKLLGSDPKLIDYYCQQVRIRGDLEWHFSAARFGMETARQGARFVEHSRKAQHRKYVRISLAIAALLTFCLGLTFYLIHASEVPAVAVRFNPAAEYRITGGKGKSVSDPGALSKGDTLFLTTGAAELNLEEGISAIIEAPARLTFIGSKRISLTEGQGYFEVSRPEGRGFTVELPDSVVTDLGTRFGIIKKHGESAEIHVFQGQVEAKRNGKYARRLPILGANTAVREDDASDTGFSLLANDASQFAKKLPAGAGTFHLGFDETDEYGSFVADGLGPDGKVKIESLGAGRLQSVPGMRGRGLRFDGSGTRLRVTGWEGIHSDQPRTVSCWVKLPRISDRSAASGMGLVTWGGSGADRNRLWEVMVNPWTFHSAGFLRTGTGDGEANVGNTYLFDGKWHHIASVFAPQPGVADADCVKMFIDGKLERTVRSLIPGVNTRRTDTMLIGSGQYAEDPWPLDGVIDEISVFRTALDETEILRLANPSPK